MGKDVIIACDFPSGKETLAFLENFKEERPFVKIGMELFYAEGPDIVRQIKRAVTKYFLILSCAIFPTLLKRQCACCRFLMLTW